MKLMNSRAFTLAEIMLAMTITVFMMGVVFSFYHLSNNASSTGIPRQQLQNDSGVILGKILEGKSEPGGVFRLSEMVSYNRVSINELHFWGIDGAERWIRLDNASGTIIYHHPTAAGPADEIIYTASPGVTITLRFSTPVGAQYTGVVIGIDVALTNTISGNTVSGSVSTYVNMRNHAV